MEESFSDPDQPQSVPPQGHLTVKWQKFDQYFRLNITLDSRSFVKRCYVQVSTK